METKNPDKSKMYISPLKEMITAFINGEWMQFHRADVIHSLTPIADWNKLRDKFFKECVDSRVVKDAKGIPYDYQQWINYAPHDLFKWFKAQVTTEILDDKK